MAKNKRILFELVYAMFIICVMSAALFLTLGQNGHKPLYVASAVCFIFSTGLFKLLNMIQNGRHT